MGHKMRNHVQIVVQFINLRTVQHNLQDWGTNILLFRLAYSYSIVLVVLTVFVLKALINLYVRSKC